MADPRVFFAIERTTLAWLRTGIAMMGFGFVVARFWLFMKYLARQDVHASQQGFSLAIGIILVCVGSLTCIMSGLQYWISVHQLEPGDLPRRYVIHLATLASLALGILGTLLAIHLI